MSQHNEDKMSDLFSMVDSARSSVGEQFRDEVVTSLYADAQQLADEVVTLDTGSRFRRTFGQTVDYYITHPLFGFPLMIMLLAVVFWLTVSGANIPSSFLAGALMEEGGLSEWFQTYIHMEAPAFLATSLYEHLNHLFDWLHIPDIITGITLDGVYLCLAWVIAVMLPPMAIFFPLFTLLEDLGYLPRVAFNLDWLFKAAGAHGKQSLTMSMGFGCNAAGIIACRIIDSPREKLIAILTNNFMICNGRFPTVIAVATLLAATAVPKGLISVITASTIVGVVLLGVFFTIIVSWVLSKTVLKGEASSFTLELPPYRRPAIMRIIYTSIIDRTMFVLARACIVAAPAGAVIWILGNVTISGTTLADYSIHFLDPVGNAIGLDGVILLAYIIAIPANEIVVPVILMLYLHESKMLELTGPALGETLTANGWSAMTAVCLLLFCLLHNPCGTTIWTIYRETRSKKWTIFGSLMPVAVGLVVCLLVSLTWRTINGFM